LQVSAGVYPRVSTAPDTVTGIFAMNITKGNTCKFAGKMGAIVMLCNALTLWCGIYLVFSLELLSDFMILFGDFKTYFSLLKSKKITLRSLMHYFWLLTLSSTNLFSNF
jgi:hypothetical protein